MTDKTLEKKEILAKKLQKLSLLKKEPLIAIFDELEEVKSLLEKIADKEFPEIPPYPEMPKMPEMPIIPETDLSKIEGLLTELLNYEYVKLVK